MTELQDAFAVFLSDLLQDKTLTAAVDGKTNKQMLDKNGDVLQMLNVFVHNIKLTLQEWSISGEKTNEPNCLKQHLGELLRDFPHLKILTGDAIYAQRPLLQALQEHHLDYVFQIKENQPAILEAMKLTFDHKDKQVPAAKSVSKKKAV
ncbi:hypothetical protein FACS189427_13270 [Planctomycetales bacterium]|nr:hypothetical protein FACS189427_13270 [Planctomycetales bacterium]